MNHFDRLFFSKYLQEGTELLYVCHKHLVLITDTVLVWMFFGALLPSFLYFNDSFHIASLVPFFYFKVYLIGIYLYLLYKIFDWYNDVWLITDQGLVDIDWNVFAGDVTYVDYRDVRGVEIHKSSIFDALLGKGDLIVHMDSEDGNFILEGASDPQDIADYIQGVIMELEQSSDEHDKAPMDVLLETLTSMVREHLEGKGSSLSENERREEEKKLEKALHRKGTIDLR